MNNKKKIAFFDFDGTITTADSFLEFLKFSLGYIRLFFSSLVLSPVIILYLLKIFSNEKAKRICMSFFYKNNSIDKLSRTAQEFSRKILPGLVKQSALDRINWHKAQGHEVYLVSASCTLWLSFWCEKVGIKLIATELEIKNNRLTGKFATRNCYGQEKVDRIKKAMDLSSFGYIYAYGDTKGDREMLEMADESYYRHFE